MSKKEHILKQQSEFLEVMKKIQTEKDVDAIAELFLNVIQIYGLKMDETAALLYYIQEKSIKAEHNAKFIKDKLTLDVNVLGIEGVLQVQRALVNTYIHNKLTND